MSSSDSEDSERSSSQPRNKRPRLAIPECVTGLFTANSGSKVQADGQEDWQGQLFHQGRKRRVPHVEGNYPTLLFLPLPAEVSETNEKKSWKCCADTCAAALQELAGRKEEAEVHLMDAGTAPGRHVSLSPLLILRRQFIEPLHNHLRSVVRTAGGARAVFFDDCVHVFSSKDRDRYFAGLCVSEASAGWLRKLSTGVLGAADALGLAGSFALPTDDMRPHCSLAWTVADIGAGLEACGAKCSSTPWGLSWNLETSSLPASLRSVPDPPDVPAVALHAKVGDRVTSHRFAQGDGD